MGVKRREGVLRQYSILVLVEVIELNEGDKLLADLTLTACCFKSHSNPLNTKDSVEVGSSRGWATC